MDLDFTAGEEEFRRRARDWLAAHVPAVPLPSLETAEGFAAHREWERELAADRWSAVSWPEEYGGQGVDIVKWLVFEEAYYAAGAPGRVSQNGIHLLAPTLFDFGTAEQRARVLPAMASGEVIWAQAWSEPEAGSDLASLRSTARRVAGGWLLRGQKTWSSRAAFADRAFGLFCTGPDGAGAGPGGSGTGGAVGGTGAVGTASTGSPLGVPVEGDAAHATSATVGRGAAGTVRRPGDPAEGGAAHTASAVGQTGRGGEPGAGGASGGVYTAGVRGAGSGAGEAGAGGKAEAGATGKAGTEAGVEAKGKAGTEAGAEAKGKAGAQAKGKAGAETAGKTGGEGTGKTGGEATGKMGGVPAKPHHGLTYVMFPLDADGVTVRPVGRLDGKPAFAELFLDDVFVPDEDVIGEPGQGWRIAMSATGNERGLTLRSPGRFLASADRLVRDWRARGDPSDTALRDRVADAVIGARAYELFAWACASRFAAGEAVGAESSLNKVFWSEYDIALHETALDLLGPEGELTDGTDWSEGYVFSLAGPIYAGTNEIQRDIIAERLLGLPKGRR